MICQPQSRQRLLEEVEQTFDSSRMILDEFARTTA